MEHGRGLKIIEWILLIVESLDGIRWLRFNQRYQYDTFVMLDDNWRFYRPSATIHSRWCLAYGDQNELLRNAVVF